MLDVTTTKTASPQVTASMTQQNITTDKPGKLFRKARFWAVVFAAMSLFLGLLLALLIYLPGAVEHQVGRILNRLSADGAFILRVKYIGLYRTEFSLHAADQAQTGAEALRISSCSLRYRPLRLLRGELDQIELDGFRLALDLTPGNSPLPLLKLFPRPAKSIDAPAQALRISEWAENLPVHFSHLSLKGDILLLTQQEVIPVPTQIFLSPGQVSGRPEWVWSLSLTHSRNTLQASGICDLAGATVTAQSRFSGTVNALPYSLRQLLPPELDADLTGQASFSFDLDKRKFTALQAEIESSIRYQHEKIQVNCQPRLTLLAEKEHISAEMQGLQAKLAGTNVSVKQLNAQFSQNDLNTVNGQIQLEIQQQVFFSTDVRVHRENGKILLEASSQPSADLPELKLNLAGSSLLFKAPECQISAELSPAWQYQVMAGIGSGKFSAAGLEGSLGGLKFAVQGDSAAANLQATFSNLHVSSTVDCSIPELHCQATFQNGQLQGNCRIPEGNAELPQQGLHANFAAEIPLQWPLSGQGSPVGFFRVDPLLGKGEKLGSLEGNFQIAEQQISFQAASDLRGLQANFNADVFPFAAPQEPFLTCHFELPEQTLPPDLLPKQFVPQLKGFQCEGKLAAGGHFILRKNAEPHGEAFLKISDGQLRNPEKDFSLDGLRLEFEMPDLPKLASDGNQLLAFRNLEFGKFAIRSGGLRFRMESPTSWHLENVTMNWCDGKLKLDSTRINPENKRTSLIFYCDRLRLSALLQQLGAGLDQGEGRISGAIPVVFSDAGLRFRDAFLFSTPGETGSIKLLPSKSISATAAASEQLSFALDALADFDYSWVKLSLNSEKDLLKIKLQTDGRPAGKLYYIPKDGTLVRSEVANDFTGLELDANLNIPLNNTLQLYQNFKQLFSPQ